MSADTSRLIILTADQRAAVLATLRNQNCRGLASAVEQDVRCGTCRWWRPIDRSNQTGNCEYLGNDDRDVETENAFACSKWEMRP